MKILQWVENDYAETSLIEHESMHFKYLQWNAYKYRNMRIEDRKMNENVDNVKC